MKKLKNKVLDKIYNDFMKKKGFEQKKKPNKIVKYIPILNFFKFMHFDAVSQVSMIYGALCVAMGCLPFFVPNHLIHANHCYIMATIFLSMIYSLNVWCYDKTMQEKDELEEMEVGNIALSVEDFNTIISTSNKTIVSKLIGDNEGEIKYNNLVELDGLLLNESDTLNTIYNENIDKVLAKIDREKLVAILKNKGMEEMIYDLKSSGLIFKDLELIMKEDKVFSKIVASNKNEEVLI